MYSCQALVILITLFLKIIPINTLQCYVCNSLDDQNCATKPKVIAVCPQLSTGCTKITSLEYKYHYRFRKNVGQNELTWDGEDLDWTLTPKPQHIVVRKCYNTYNRLKKQSGCHRISYVRSNVTVCICKRSFCNGTSKMNLNITILILSLLVNYSVKE